MAGKRKKRARSAVTGRFITLKEAKKRPRTTVVETIKKSKTKKRKK